MAFGDEDWEKYLPSYLLSTDKLRLRIQLNQFSIDNINQISYNDFYLNDSIPHLMTGDVWDSMPFVDWNSDQNQFINGFSPVMLLSNSCDVSRENGRNLQKDVMFAKVIPLSNYIEVLEEDGLSGEMILSIKNNLVRQLFSNIIYLPNHKEGEELLVFLDKICSLPAEVMSNDIDETLNQRYSSLSNFGYYLLLTKISFHFCRTPEEIERPN